MDQPDLRSPENYINRELSLLAFNERVLAQALDEKVPLLERLKFLCISCSNLDEFFEIRVAGLKQRLELGSAVEGPDATSVAELLQSIRREAAALIGDQYELLNQFAFPELEKRGMRFVNSRNFAPQHLEWLREFFAQ